MSNLATIPLTTIAGAPATLADYAGRVVLIVNVASQCGLTPQYTALEALYQRFQADGLTILGFPANDFGAQEPGSNEEIATFCSTTYPVSFPLFAKIAVTGPEQHPLYAELTNALPDPIGEGPWRAGIANYARRTLELREIPPRPRRRARRPLLARHQARRPATHRRHRSGADRLGFCMSHLFQRSSHEALCLRGSRPSGYILSGMSNSR
jgi:glutathione peroxidase